MKNYKTNYIPVDISNKPKTIFEIDPNFTPSKRVDIYNCYDNKPLKKWSSDDFASYILDCSNSNGTVFENYFSDCLKHYFDTLPLLKGINERVYLYGIYSIIKNIMTGKI